MKSKQEYKGKLFSILGDSISTLSGYNPEEFVYYNRAKSSKSKVNFFKDTWWGSVIDSLEGLLLVNNSISGSCVSQLPNSETEYHACSDERTSSLDKDGLSPDVIMVFMGSNDWGWAVDLQSSDADSNDISCFKPAYEEMLKKLKRNYPSAEIWCLTLGKLIWEQKPNSKIPSELKRKDIAEYCKIIRDCAEKFDCDLIDIYNIVGTYDLFENGHPTAIGMKQIADAVLSVIR